MFRSILTTIFAASLLGAAPRFAHASDPAAAFQRSYEQEAAGQYRDALASLDAFAPNERDAYVFALRRAWLLYLAGDHKPAISAYDHAGSLAPKAIEPLLGKLLPQMALRRWRAAVSTARRVLQRAPKNDHARQRLAFSLYNLGQFEGSRRRYAELLAEYPSKVELRAGLGWCLLRLGRSAQAATEFAAVLAVAPKHASAAQGLAALQRVANGR